jgi:hypothetical protein
MKVASDIGKSINISGLDIQFLVDVLIGQYVVSVLVCPFVWLVWLACCKCLFCGQQETRD